ncbi:hypothetical protein AVEN_148159-1 [Araneus ventricosus]|uniref:Uncharacterized protein n=1 Tax=Araneus ventricosus TaxID=182803 RepID=A0A4Y2UCK8_ARAVE|nr:hypothetical protein AVEN_148159-1 [Araneus ventricosus]
MTRKFCCWVGRRDVSNPTNQRAPLFPLVRIEVKVGYMRPVSCIPVTKEPVSHRHRCNRSNSFWSVKCLLGKRCLYSLSASKSFPFARPYIKCMSAFPLLLYVAMPSEIHGRNDDV